jgi:hypothetical protein
MQGLWKNNVSSWNSKGSKRKKQTRKNFLKDKAKAVYRIFEGKNTHKNDTRNKPNIFRRENEIVKVYKSNRKYQKTAVVQKALITWVEYSYKIEMRPRVMMDGSVKKFLTKVQYSKWCSTKRLVYIDNDRSVYNLENTIDYETGLRITNALGLSAIQNNVEVKILSNTYEIVELNWQSRKALDEKWYNRPEENYNQKVFLYGKPINRTTFWRYWNDGRRRKCGQKMVNGSDRTALREWISKKDWDKEPRSYQYSKSIDWYVN